MPILIDLILIIFCAVVLYHLYQGAIFLPTHPQTVKKIVEVAKIKPGMKAVDLGSGDGRLVVALAKAGFLADGFEINPALVLWSKIKIKQAGLNNARIFGKSFWATNLSQYDVVVVFGMSHIMDRLEDKFKSELRANTLIISNVFQFKDLTELESHDGIHVYIKKSPENF